MPLRRGCAAAVRFQRRAVGTLPAMTDDEEHTYHHNAAEGETRAPSGDEPDPHHALNTPVGAIDEDVEAMLDTEDDEGERLEDADDAAEDERTSEGRTPTD